MKMLELRHDRRHLRGKHRGGKGGKHCAAAGFSLLELMTVVAIIGILLAIAAPTYHDHAERNRRLDARIALQEIAARQQQYHLEHLTYAATIEALNHLAHTPAGSYTLRITTADAYGFRAEARIAPEGPQAGDHECAVLRLDANHQRSAVAQDGADSTSTCWPGALPR